MRLITPKSLHYPITVTKLLRKISDQVDCNAPLFNYEYKSTVIEGSEDNKEGRPVQRTWPSTFESYVEGTLSQWMIDVGRVIARPGVVIAEIDEVCKHEVQFGGMCAECGKDMTTVAYNTVNRDTARATVNAVHGHTALLVSHDYASKSEERDKRRLLSSRKLSLVVDLDQTIIHATVDPTVAEWQKDTTNPNHGAVKDVRAFQLLDAGPGARGCWYYIKLRPGLQDFLATISKYYELHIYTMGTRAYAENIAKIIDPESKIFGHRILSRDESGSMTVKNLKRLFPVDSKMVVIIDDRGDVWHWSRNLIKVIPYDFFVGIGDINSSFLPKRHQLEVKPPQPDAGAVIATDQAVAPQPAASPVADAQAMPPATSDSQTGSDISAIEQLMSMGGASNDPGKLQEQTSAQDETIAAQLADRPLLQKQKILDAAEGGTDGTTAQNVDVDELSKDEPLPESQPRYRQNLLQNSDNELEYLQQSLKSVHQSFFEEYDRRTAGLQGGRIAELRPGSATKKRIPDDLENLPDVTGIMAAMKQQVLHRVHLVFSGVVPLDVDIHSHDLAIWAKSFGATVSENITKRTTHVITSPHRRTAKVRQAMKKPNRIKIVTQNWLFACLSQWRRVDADAYRIHTEAAENDENPTTIGNESPFDGPDGNPLLSSSDEDATVTEDDNEIPNGSDNVAETGTSTQEISELEQHMPSLSREDSSLHEETNEDWDNMNDELADFLGSDAEDESGSDAESTKSTESSATESDLHTRRKRKRDADGSILADENDSDASQDGSELQKRKRKALARTTSLTNVAAFVNSPRTAPVKAEAHPGGNDSIPEEGEKKKESADGSDADAAADAALEAELEAEMLRQIEEDGGNG